jgi:hypothetical protein
LNQHKAWFDEDCLRFLDQRKWVKIQWLQDPKQSNVDNLNNVRHKAGGYFRKKTKDNLKVKIAKLKINWKINNIRDV